MTGAGLTFRELIAWSDVEAVRWQIWFASQPDAILELPAGTGRTATVRGLIHHIIVVECRYVDRVRGEPVTEYAGVPRDDLAVMFAIRRDTRRRLEAWLEVATEADLARVLDFDTISAGAFRATARKVIAHALLHGVRHWAQVATILRQHGHATDWGHDLLLSDALD